MKKHPLIVTVLLIVALLSLVIPSPVSAGGEPIGERIYVWSDGSQEFQAGAPFYIMHGWVDTSDIEAMGVFDFELDVDGVPVKEGFKQFYVESGDPDILFRYWVYTFPDGLTGTHTFTGHWYAPCQYAAEYTGGCFSPNKKVENKRTTVVVTFTP